MFKVYEDAEKRFQGKEKRNTEKGQRSRFLSSYEEERESDSLAILKG
ncbi:hypothetical protein ACT691_14610 [Vibrio metschnikovii]